MENVGEQLKGLRKFLNREKFDQLSRDEIYQVFCVLLAITETQQARIEELERRLGMNSRNSSKPPSTDQPGTRPVNHEPSGRKPGGQPGHEAHFRQPVPAEEVTQTKVVKPTRCGHCYKPLKGEDLNPRRFQVFDLPARIKLEVIEYLLQTLECPHCHHRTAAKLPRGVKGCLGPRAQGLVATLTGILHLSKDKARMLLEDVFGLPLSHGAISNCEKQVAAALEKPVVQAQEWVQEQPAAHADETGWFQKHKINWVWTLATRWVSVFKVLRHRDATAMNLLLGKFKGVLVADRYPAYNKYGGLRQICWAHLMRDFHGLREMRGRPGRLGLKLEALGVKVFTLWHKARDGILCHRTMARKMAPLKRQMHQLLLHGRACPHRKVRKFCARILKAERHVWTFTRKRGVDPTNNAAERALRPAVLWRKCSLGTRSARGNIFVERILTVRASLRQQKRNMFTFLAEACGAELNGSTPPSLLPVSNCQRA